MYMYHPFPTQNHVSFLRWVRVRMHTPGLTCSSSSVPPRPLRPLLHEMVSHLIDSNAMPARTSTAFSQYVYFSCAFAQKEKRGERERENSLYHTTSSRKIDPLGRRSIAEPAHPLRSLRIHQATRQTRALLGFKNLLNHLLLAGPRGHKGNLGRMHHHGQAERDAFRRRLGRVIDGEDPRILLA